MTDTTLFTAGSLFTSDYLTHGITETADYEAVDTVALAARLFILYGVTDRDDVRYIFSTFPIVEREETTRWHRYRSRDLTLAWINALLAGQPNAEIDG